LTDLVEAKNLTFDAIPSITRGDLQLGGRRQDLENAVATAASLTATAAAEELGLDEVHCEATDTRLVPAASMVPTNVASGFLVLVSNDQDWSALLIVDFSVTLAAVDACLRETPRTRQRLLSPIERGLAIGLAARLCWRTGGAGAFAVEAPSSSRAWFAARANEDTALSVVSLRVQIGECVGKVRVAAPLPKTGRRTLSLPIGRTLGQANWVCTVSAPPLVLAIADLRTLEPGALLVGLRHDILATLTMTISGMRLLDVRASAVGDRRIEIAAWRENPSLTGTAMNVRASLSDENAGLEMLPVQVDLVIGSVTLPLEKIAALRSGAVVELDRPVGGEVELKLGAGVIARGELVQIEGNFGVRIVWVAP
jgi:flagellar motor switch/type III secretory pathway protein FliN